LPHKRALGFTYLREEAFLREFDRLVLREPSDFISENLVRIYLSIFSPRARPQRLTLIHQLARFLIFEEPRTFIPGRSDRTNAQWKKGQYPINFGSRHPHWLKRLPQMLPEDKLGASPCAAMCAARP
jgi:hypothetical protein